MLSKWIFTIFISILILPGYGYCATVGASDLVLDGSLISLALEYDYIADRDFKSDDFSSGEIEEQSSIYLVFSIRPKERDYLTVYGKFGATEFETRLDLNSGAELFENYGIGTLLGGGFRIDHKLVPKVTVSMDNQFNWFSCDADQIRFLEAESNTPSGRATAFEYQISGIVSYKIDWESMIHPAHGEFPFFQPYAGIKFAHLDMDSNARGAGPGFDIAAPADRKNGDKFGMFGGVELGIINAPNLRGNLEVRFLDEFGASGKLTYSF
ncbi:hypothetical protein ACFL0T_01165 [Candidatus Omnitrophota bacterium]